MKLSPGGNVVNHPWELVYLYLHLVDFTYGKCRSINKPYTDGYGVGFIQLCDLRIWFYVVLQVEDLG